MFCYKIEIQKALFKEILRTFYYYFNAKIVNFDCHEITLILTIQVCDYCKVSIAFILKSYKIKIRIVYKNNANKKN